MTAMDILQKVEEGLADGSSLPTIDRNIKLAERYLRLLEMRRALTRIMGVQVPQ